MRDPGSIPRGVFMWNQDSPISVVSLCWWPRRNRSLWPHLRRLCPDPSLGHPADNVIIPLDLAEPFWPGFTLTAGHASGFTTDIVSCCGGALWRACNLTAFTPCLTGPVGYLFASRHEGPRFNTQKVLKWNRDSPVGVVSLQYLSTQSGTPSAQARPPNPLPPAH